MREVDEWANDATNQQTGTLRDSERYDRRRRGHRRGSRRNEIVKLAMKTKIRDAWDEIREQRRIEQRMWRQLRPKLIEKRKENEFNEMWE